MHTSRPRRRRPQICETKGPIPCNPRKLVSPDARAKKVRRQCQQRRKTAVLATPLSRESNQQARDRRLCVPPSRVVCPCERVDRHESQHAICLCRETRARSNIVAPKLGTTK